MAWTNSLTALKHHPDIHYRPGMTTSTHLRPDLTDKVVVVTGPAEALAKIAIACAQRGAAVVLNGRNQERLASAKAAVEEHTSSVHVVCGDVSDPKEGRRLTRRPSPPLGDWTCW